MLVARPRFRAKCDSQLCWILIIFGFRIGQRQGRQYFAQFIMRQCIDPVNGAVYFGIMILKKHKGFLEYRIRADEEKPAGLHNLKCFFHWIIVTTRLDEGMKGPKARSV